MRNSSLSAAALWLRAPRTPELRSEQVPPPGPGQIRVAAIASAISHGTEMLLYRGQIPAGMALDLPTLAGSFAFPIKYGYASVGHVLDRGPGVSAFAPGDAVFCLHPHQSIYLAPVELAMPLPAELDPLLGVFAANVETALGIAHDTALSLGETVVIFGLGVVGLLALQTLRLAGAGRIIGVDPLERRRNLALELGADAALAPGPGLPEELRAHNGGRPADAALEVSSAPAALQQAIDCVMPEGVIIVASWYGSKPLSLELGGHFHRGRLRLRSSQVGRIAPELSARWDKARRIAAVRDLLPRLRLAELISQRFPLSQAAAAYRLIDEEPAATIQVVLEIEHEA